MLSLKTPVEQIKMIGPIYADRLKKLNIYTIEDLLYHIPFRYQNYSNISKINLLQEGEIVTVVGKIIKFENIYTKYGKKIQKAIIADDTGEIEAIWYNQPYLVSVLRPNLIIAISGKVSKFSKKMSFQAPDYEIIKNINFKYQNSLVHSGRLVPVYNETAGISSKWLRSRIFTLLFKIKCGIPDFLSVEIVNHFNLLSEKQAIYNIHFPTNLDEALRAKQRLAFDELLILQLVALARKKRLQKEKVKYKFEIKKYMRKIQTFVSNLPFELTNDQKNAIKEILTDLSLEKPMNRLLEGDVGSGKTVVATVAIYCAYLNHTKSILMAPTEILALQHYETIKKLLRNYNIKTGLLTKSNKLAAETDYDVVIGTHALIYQQKILKKIGLIVIDEQQRFGVKQRAVLREKGQNPHVLTMTATPIPRSLALSIYADLDLSEINQLPSGRQIIKTWVVPPNKRQAAYQWIENKITETLPHKQAYIICPLIEESESLEDVKAVTAEYENLKHKIFPNLQIALLHGRLKSKEKQDVLEAFRKGKIDILVSTPVIEVGIDIPQAIIMMIEAADRFGLSQLHQLRGRVGRSSYQSYCLLFTETESQKTLKRLKLLETTYSGPKLAELDLKLRGPGEIFGTKQHGQLGLKYADFSDLDLIKKSKKASEKILKIDLKLSLFPLLQEKLQKYKIDNIAPD